MKTFAIVTPENVELEYRVAGVTRRGLAWALDQLFVGTAVLAILYPLRYLAPVLGGFGAAVQFLVYFAVSTLYPICFEARDGQTPGKKALKVRVFSDRGTPVTLAEAVLRNLLRAVDALPFFYLLGGISASLSRDGRRLGDRAAGTLVVEELRRAAPSAFRAADSGRHNTFLENPAIFALARRRLSPDDREALLDLCLRRDLLDERPRLALFGRYAGYLRRKLARPDLAEIADERLVFNCVEALLRDRRRPTGLTL